MNTASIPLEALKGIAYHKINFIDSNLFPRQLFFIFQEDTSKLYRFYESLWIFYIMFLSNVLLINSFDINIKKSVVCIKPYPYLIIKPT